jgi:hypothetical protein
LATYVVTVTITRGLRRIATIPTCQRGPRPNAYCESAKFKADASAAGIEAREDSLEIRQILPARIATPDTPAFPYLVMGTSPARKP